MPKPRENPFPQNSPEHGLYSVIEGQRSMIESLDDDILRAQNKLDAALKRIAVFTEALEKLAPGFSEREKG